MTRTYDEWREILDRELEILVLDDEGRRRCQRDGRLTRPLTRQQAESYYAWNSFVRRRAESGQHQ
ncbi:MAG: hypothetical protein ACYTG2_08760 [Planctomycetota bacterium]|jgi:hypothetical protein